MLLLILGGIALFIICIITAIVEYWYCQHQDCPPIDFDNWP